MKILIWLSIFSTPAFAAQYACKAEVSARRGPPVPVVMLVSPDANGGNLDILYQDRVRRLGRATMQTLHRADSRTADLFRQIISQLATPKLSGVKNTANISAIIKYAVVNQAANDVAVFRFFAGPMQVGGSVIVDSHATICVAKGMRAN